MLRKSKLYYNQTKISVRLHASLLPNHAQEMFVLGTTLLADYSTNKPCYL